MTAHFANLFAENIDVSVSFPTWNRRFKSNSFDTYSQEGNNIEIRHSVNQQTKGDEFIVQAMIYEYKGCWVGNQVNFGKFNTFADAVFCAETTKLPEGSVSQTEAFSLM